MLALCLMLLGTYYAQNYAGIIGRSLIMSSSVFYYIFQMCFQKVLVKVLVMNDLLPAILLR